jgi:LmbE family N-acetylglucosaminyl deacetylase
MMNLTRATIAWLFSLLTITATAQTPRSYHAAEIMQQLQKLKTLGAVLYVAAHPDDENTRLLAYLANEKKYRTGYLSLTRGDGGQNLIGDEQGIDLGLIRTQELLAARRIDGAEQFFTRAYDFGYCKSPEEALQTWGHEAILSDVVRVIRQFKPDIIICRFPTTGEGGHGHHTASAILAEEAFVAAADPSRFPEQLQGGLRTWQAKRVLWNTFNFGSNNTQREDQFKLDVGLYNPLLGKSYGEMAALSRSQHKSQGFGVPAQRGTQTEYFKTTKGTAPVKDLMDDITTDWSRIAGAGSVTGQIDAVLALYDVRQPALIVSALIRLRKQIAALSVSAEDTYWQQQKLRETDILLTACMGFYAEATVSNQLHVRGDSMRVNLTYINRSNQLPEKISVQLMTSVIDFGNIVSNQTRTQSQTLFLSDSLPSTQPFWLKKGLEANGRFVVDDPSLIGMAEDLPYFAEFRLTIQGETITFRVPVQYKYTDPVKGELYQPIQLVDPVFVGTTPSLLVFNTNDKKQTKKMHFDLQYNRLLTDRSNLAYYRGKEKVSVFDSVMTLSKGDKKQAELTLSMRELKAGQSEQISPVFLNTRIKNSQEMTLRKISYDHIPDIFYQYRDPVKLVAVDLKTAGNTAGYIAGAGDKVPEALEQMGYKVTQLKEPDITPDNLRQFDVIVTGVRAHNTNEWMNTVHEVLMQYVEAGGTLLVQYNTASQIGPVKAKMGPYPFSISRNRITDQNAAVRFLRPDHPILQYPNSIKAADFEGWVQERSIYHAEKTDSNYVSLLSMADPGEKEDDGALIVSDYGKGRFIYTGLVFFRELPAGVPGAYRLFANLIANKNKMPAKQH